MNIQAKAAEVVKAQAEYTNSDGTIYAEMEEKGWDSLLDTADRAICQQVFGMDSTVGQPWHDELLDEICELKNARV